MDTKIILENNGFKCVASRINTFKNTTEKRFFNNKTKEEIILITEEMV